ncbi:MAG: pyridoxal 5'-phosphate synthase lyase subunit PdxS [Candidatus Thermoplasmatota archaeon]|jgi:pyridoxal 5'-phosphate synthase pdxS subunit|nr:pyridoxal 5'-phosphate synthase lyase subunit PdxS [Candidatus Thermoplasmatota archaeon]MCL5793732.1 pyridoxal 5'-phosphate synthase lyase subunit PdxS [Candidatus Thermoplasmatota archaeon]
MPIDLSSLKSGDDLLKRGFAKMTKGGVIMDVTTVEQARVAESSGAVAVMALEKVPADIRMAGGVARMADPMKIKEIMEAVTIPVMAKVRIGHVSEAYTLSALGVDMIDESEVLTPADPHYHINKKEFKIPFVCGARTVSEAVRRIFEGASMIRTKGEAGTGNVIEAVRHMWAVNTGVEMIKSADLDDLAHMASRMSLPYLREKELVAEEVYGDKGKVDLKSLFYGVGMEGIEASILEVLKEIKEAGRLPVVNFAAGGIATPADGALMMKMGADGVFVGSGIFKSRDPNEMAKAIVDAVENFEDYEIIGQVSSGLSGMPGIDVEHMGEDLKLQNRGW